MEKYARQAVSEGLKNVDDIHVSDDSEIYRVLNLHYNRNHSAEVSFSAPLGHPGPIMNQMNYVLFNPKLIFLIFS